MTDQQWQLVNQFVPTVISVIVLVIVLVRRSSDSAEARNNLVVKMADTAIDSSVHARKASEAAEKAATLLKASDEKMIRLEAKVGDLEKSGTAKDAQIIALENQVKGLEARVEDLNKKYNERGDELREKDAIILSKEAVIAAKDNEIKELHARLLEYANAAPSNVPPTPPTTDSEPPVMDVNIVAQAAPVEVIAPPDDEHSLNNAEQVKRATAELERRLNAAPPSVDADESAA